jgi:hypothetical protein
MAGRAERKVTMPDSESTPEVTVFQAKAMAQTVEGTLNEIRDCSACLLETALAENREHEAESLRTILQLAQTGVEDIKGLVEIIEVIKARPLASNKGTDN